MDKERDNNPKGDLMHVYNNINAALVKGTNKYSANC